MARVMEAEHLLPPLEHTPTLPEQDGSASVPGSIQELTVLRPPKVAAEPAHPDDGGWQTVAGLAPPSNEGALALKALDAWAGGVAEQAQLYGHALDAEHVKEILQENNAFSVPRSLLGLATAAAAATVALRSGDHEDLDEDEDKGKEQPTAAHGIDAPLTPPRSPKHQAESSETELDQSIDSESTGEKKGKKSSRTRSKTKGSPNVDTDDKTQKKKTKTQNREGGQRWTDTRETMWIQASDEGWTGREASISRILEQHQLASKQEPAAVELAALRDKLREMTTQELQHEELNRPVHQPSTRAGHSETFSFHSEAYKVTPLPLGGKGAAATVHSELDELELAKKMCPRLNLLSPSQAVDLLHMTHPEELGAVLNTMSSIDKLVYKQPPPVSSCSLAMAAVEVVAVQQLLAGGQTVTLPLARALPSAHFAVPAESDSESPPQAQWIESLFSLIVETQRRQLEWLRAQWPTQGRFLCDYLQPENDQGMETTNADLCCLQVLLLALNLKISDVLRLDAELTVSGVELETTIDAETSIPRLSDITLWEKAEELVRRELSAARRMRVKQAAEEDAQSFKGTTLLQHLIVRLVGLRCTLSRRDVADIVRLREDGHGEIEVSMLVQAPTSTGTTITSWHGCLYGWELKLYSEPLFTTTQTPNVLRTIFTGLSEVSSLSDALPDQTLQLPTTIIEGPNGSGRSASFVDACTAIFGVSFKLVSGDQMHSDSSELTVSARALARFPFVLILDDANCVSRSALEDAMSQPHLVPSGSVHGFSGFACTFDPERESALHSKLSMNRIIARNDTVAITIRAPDDMLVEYTLFNVFSCCSDTAAFVAAAYFSSDAGKQICSLKALMSLRSMLSSSAYSKDDDATVLEIFRWLGREVTFAALEPRPGFTGCATADIVGAWTRLDSQIGRLAAHRRYHRRLLASIYSKGAHSKGVDVAIRNHVLTGRRFHAADVVAVLCNFPELVTKHHLMGLQPAEGGVAADWPGTRNVRSDYLEVHISGSGEGYHGPGALWAGKSAWGLLSKPVQTEPHRELLPMVLAVDAALTTLELLPAILHSGGAKELLTLPPTQALLAAKWKLLRVYWLLELTCFLMLFLMFMSHALVEGHVARRVLLAFTCLFTLPLFWIEWRQHSAVCAMRGVGASAAKLHDQPDPAGSTLLARHMRYLTMHNIMDLTGLILVWVSTVVALATGSSDDASADALTVAEVSLGWRSSTLVAFTLLSLCIKLVSFLKVNTAMGFLVSVITTCTWSMRQFLVFMVVVVVVSGTTFQLQFASLVMYVPPNSPDALAESTLGGPGSRGLMNSIWTSFLFAILGEFNPELFWAGGVAVIVVFVLVTLLVNVVMLNILIAIVSDAFKEQREQADYLSAKLTAETIFGIDSCFPRKRRAAFHDSDHEVANGDEYHNEIQYEHRRFHKVFAWAYQERLKCSITEATLHVLSARASADCAAAAAALKDVAGTTASQEQAEQETAKRQRQEREEWGRKQKQVQKDHEEHCEALMLAHNQTKAELQAANTAREHTAYEAKQAVEAARAAAKEQAERAASAAAAEMQSRLGLELERISEELDAHKRAGKASADETAALEEAHAAAQSEIQDLKTASEKRLMDAAKELQIAQELAAEELARVEAEAAKLKAEKVELEEIAAQLKAEAEASTVKGRRKKKQ